MKEAKNGQHPLKYRRVLLKLSGEALMGQQAYGIDQDVLTRYAAEIKQVVDAGAELAIVIGGGNIFRGVNNATEGMTRAHADYMGMLATMINGMALQDALEQAGLITRLQSSIKMEEIAEPFIRRRAIRHLEKHRVVIFGAGTGNPYFTTDTAAALRALEIDADVLLKGTRVDGVYTADPEKDPAARQYATIHGGEVLQRDLRVMDLTAFTLCKESGLPIIVFNMNTPGNLLRVVQGTPTGTLVHWNDSPATSRVHRSLTPEATTMLDEALELILEEAQEHMEKTLDHLRSGLNAVRAGRASPAMLQNIRVDYYGTQTPLNQMASISAPQPDLLIVQPWDASVLGTVERAIIAENLGLNPANDGRIIRIPVPPLSEERRRDLVKSARSRGEEAKIAVRNVRRHAKDQIKATQEEEHLSEDMRYRAEDRIQQLTDQYVERIDKILDHKEAEIMEV